MIFIFLGYCCRWLAVIWRRAIARHWVRFSEPMKKNRAFVQLVKISGFSIDIADHYDDMVLVWFGWFDWSLIAPKFAFRIFAHIHCAIVHGLGYAWMDNVSFAQCFDDIESDAPKRIHHLVGPSLWRSNQNQQSREAVYYYARSQTANWMCQSPVT